MSTNNNYKVAPSAASGVSVATGSTSWAYSSYATVINPLPQSGFITGITFCPDVTDTSLATATSCEVLIELYKGNADTLIAQIPVVYQINSRVAHVLPRYIPIQEPIQIEGGVRIRARVADSVNAVMDAQNSIKVHYYLNDPPSVVLNSPANSATGVSTTPTLEFTGTDTEANDIRYELQIATGNDFNPQLIAKSSMTNMGARTSGGDPTVSTQITDENCIVAVVTTQDSNTNNLGAVTVIRDGQSFTKINQYGGSGGNGQPVQIQIWILLNPNAGTSNTVADCNSSINECTMTVYRLKNVDTTNSVNAENGASNNGTPADLTLTTSADNCYLIGGLVSEASISGVGTGQDADSSFTDQSFENTRTTSMQGGTQGNKALVFTGESSAPYAWAIVAINKTAGAGNIVLDKISGTDNGFSNTVTGGDTDPFNSGEKIAYTVQAGDTLANSTTYYWRVRGIDPNGSNTYGAWSTTRSFTTEAGSIGTASVVPVTTTITPASPTATYAANLTAGVVPATTTITPISPSATYNQEQTASVTPGTLTLTPVSPTATFIVSSTASVSPASTTIIPVSSTATYLETDVASVSPAITTLTPVSPTATYLQTNVASVDPATTSLTPISPNASYIQIESGAVSPKSLTITPVSSTATYVEVYSGAVAPATTTITPVSPQATYVQQNNASVSPAQITLSAVSPSSNDYFASVTPAQIYLTPVSPIATYAQVETASVSPTTVTITAVTPIATYAQVETASVSPTTVMVTAVTPEATYVQVEGASVGALLLAISSISPIATYAEIAEALVSSETLTITPVSPTPQIGLVKPVVINISLVSPAAQAHVIYQRQSKIIFVEDDLAYKIAKNQYIRL
jgi:hypothetical protein